MLSNTKGYTRYGNALGFRRDDLSALNQVCQAWRTTGKCRAYNKENELRRTLAAAKEAEILKKANALYEAQMDLVADLGDGDADAALLASVTAQAGFSTDPAKKSEMVQKLVAELKQEPAYLNWSLDAAVAERMVELKVKPCRYTHRAELANALKRNRATQEKEEERLQQRHLQEQQKTLQSDNTALLETASVEEKKRAGEDEEGRNNGGDEEAIAAAPLTRSSVLSQPTGSRHGASSSPITNNKTDKESGTGVEEGENAASALTSPDAVTASHPVTTQKNVTRTAQELQWEEERHRIFRSLTPLQRCVVCLLWQQRYRVAQGVICDVRLMLEKKLTEMYDTTGQAVVQGRVVAARRTPEHNNEGKHAVAGAERGDSEGDDDDPLDAYLSSAAFEELVEQESKRVVTRVVFRPEFGLVDLSALPLLVAHLSTTPACGVLLARTVTYFTGKALNPPPPPESFARPKQTQNSVTGKGNEEEETINHRKSSTQATAFTATPTSTSSTTTNHPNKSVSSGSSEAKPDDRPAPTSFHHLIFPARKAMTEKEIDLGGTARADEVVEAIEWGLQIFQREQQLHKTAQRAMAKNASLSFSSSVPVGERRSTPADSTGHSKGRDHTAASTRADANNTTTAHVSALFKQQRIRLHGLTLRHCKLTSADALVGALHKRSLETFLYAFDLSENRLWSLRFLLVLRAHFAARLLRLSLKSNPITRKPEYQEQVRLSLPQLTSLDGESIRRPPLQLPKPLPSSCTRWIEDEVSTASGTSTHAGANARRGGVGVKAEEDAEGGDARHQENLHQQHQQQLRQTVQASVLDCVGRLFYIWETRRIPHTLRELEAAQPQPHADRAKARSAASTFTTVVSSSSPPAGTAATTTTAAANHESSVLLKEEEEWNEDNFPHRYLHPAATFSVALSPGLNFFDAETMRDARAVEFDDAYTGMRLSAVDVRDARVFDVAMKNSSRNLLAGRPALQRFGRGAENCFLAYQFTVYPERMLVEHHVTDAVVAVAQLDGAVVANLADRLRQEASENNTSKSNNSKQNKKNKKALSEAVRQDAGGKAQKTKNTSSSGSSSGSKQQPQQVSQPVFGALTRGPAATQHVVTLHGRMTWRLPSMKGGECMQANYTRVMVFTKKVLPAQNREWERLRSPPYVLMNDALFLYPAPSWSSPALSSGPTAIFKANTAARLSRLVVEFGLEACKDGVALVRDVMERTTSPASEYAALQALVLGVCGPAHTVLQDAHGNENKHDHGVAARGKQDNFKDTLKSRPNGAHTGKNAAVTASTGFRAPSAQGGSSTGGDGAGTLVGEDAAAIELGRLASAQLTPILEAFANATTAAPRSSSNALSQGEKLQSESILDRTYVIFSVLEGASTAAENEEQEDAHTGKVMPPMSPSPLSASSHTKQHRQQQKEGQQEQPVKKKAKKDAATNVKSHADVDADNAVAAADRLRAWAAGPHVVTRALLHEVTTVTNNCYTCL